MENVEKTAKNEDQVVLTNLDYHDLSPFMLMDLASHTCHRQANTMGWWEGGRNEGELLMLVVSELSEALEARRRGPRVGPDLTQEYLSDLISGLRTRDPQSIESFKADVKDTFEDEIADVFIRLFDLCGGLGIGNTIGYHVVAKLLYNRTRPTKHGKQF